MRLVAENRPRIPSTVTSPRLALLLTVLNVPKLGALLEVVADKFRACLDSLLDDVEVIEEDEDAEVESIVSVVFERDRSRGGDGGT